MLSDEEEFETETPGKFRHFMRQTLKMSARNRLGTFFSRKKWNPRASEFFAIYFFENVAIKGETVETLKRTPI